MPVINVHERALAASRGAIGALIDTLASPRDRLWPTDTWPGMRFEGLLGIGAHGGHGPIRYLVEDYVPSDSIRFRFTSPAGFRGWHGFEIVEETGQTLTLRHTLRMRTTGLARLSWPLVYRPLHDALIEDALSKAQNSLGERPVVYRWSRWVRMLRWIASGGRAPPQTPDQRRRLSRA